MKRLFTFISFLSLTSGQLFSQSAADYSFSYSTDTYTALSGSYSVSTATGDDGGQNITLPFTFNYCGTNYTTARISVNGWLEMGQTYTGSGYSNDLASTAIKPLICGLWDDLYDDANSDIRYDTIGTSPNRIFVAEWRNILWRLSAGTQQNFQIRIKETTNIIEIIYGTMNAPANTPTASIGINDQTGGANHFISITPAANPTYSTTTANNTISSSTNLTNGLVYTFTPPSLLNPSTFTATAVSTSQIDLAFTPYAGNNVVIVWNLTGTFTTPSGAPPVVGQPFAGGTLFYNGLVSPQNHIGLNASTLYYYIAFSYNGSNYSAGITASAVTFCIDATIPFSESFDGTTFPPTCWVTQKTAGTGTPGIWDRQTVGTYPSCSPHSGAGMTRYNSFSLAAGTAGILVTPSFTLPNPSGNYRVRFWMYRDDGYLTDADLVNVQFNTLPNLTGATLLGTINRSIDLAPVESANGWYEYSFTLPSGQDGTGRFVIFEAVSQYGNNIFVDDVYLEVAPACNNPAGLAATDITGTSANLSWTPGGTETAWEYAYGLSPFPVPSGSGTATSSNTVNPISGLSPSTAYQYYARADCGTEFSTWSGPHSFTTLITCPSPTALLANNITTTSANLSWTPAGSETAWEYVYGVSPQPVPSGAGTPTNSSTVNPISPLAPQTSYQFYARAICGVGDISTWTGPYSFSTLCIETVAPWCEVFQAQTIPLCWSISGPQNWLFTNTWPAYGAAGLADHTGTGGSFAGVDGSGSAGLTGITLFSPLLDISAMTTPRLKFYVFNNNISSTLIADEQQMTVYVWDGVGGWQLAFTWPYGKNISTWEEETLLLTSYSSPIQLKFVVDKGTGSPFYDDMVVDDICIEELSGCPYPSALTVNALTGNSANLSWTPGGTETAWEYAYGLSPFPVPSGSGTATSSNTVNPISGLSPSTAYQYYARADCGTEFSTWTGPKSFTTSQVPAVLPYSETFETWPDNWDVLNGTQTNQWFVGTATAHTGTQSAYISNDGGVSNVFDITLASVVHMYRDITFTNASQEFDLSFWWKGYGESCCDYLRVYVVETSVVPVAGTLLATGQVGSYNLGADWAQANIVLPGTLSGTTKRLVFSWRNDGSVGTQPPAALDDIQIIAVPIPACPAPTGLTNTNITATTADLGWSWTADSFFDINYGIPGFDPNTGGTIIPGIAAPPYTLQNLTPETPYEWYVRSICRFSEPKIDHFWVAINEGSGLETPSGGAPLDDPGEDGVWRQYTTPTNSWYNIWFYNEPLDLTRMKIIRMGFWVQPLNPLIPGNIFYVVNWSTPAWVPPNPPGYGYPMPADEAFIERSQTNVAPVPMVDPQHPTGYWMELYYIIPDYNPEWVSVDIWGTNVTILQSNIAPPTTSPLYNWWVQSPGPGGIIVHECVPKPRGYVSPWSVVGSFTTAISCPAPTTLNATNVTAHSANLTWTPGSGETAWEYAYGPSPYPVPGGSGTATTSNTVNLISGLSGGSAYQYWVRAFCDPEFSSWSGPYTFNTPASCPAPTALSVGNIQLTSADVSWLAGGSETSWNAQVGPSGFVPGTGAETVGVVATTNNLWTATPLTPSTSYDAYVQGICGFDQPFKEYFWFAQDENYDIIPSLSGGGPVDHAAQGEDGVFYFYQDWGVPWHNVWWYNGQLDMTRMKIIRMGFWVQRINQDAPADITYVVNWSTSNWGGTGFPTPAPTDTAYIDRSPVSAAVEVLPSLPGELGQWIELYYVIPDFNPEWVSVDLWGRNVQIVYELTPPPMESPLYSWWMQDPQRGGILLHECLPKPVGDASTWVGPIPFNTLCNEATLPICESFDGTAFPPACWITQKTAGTSLPGTWDRQTTGTLPNCLPHTGAGMTRYNSFTYLDGTAGILVTPSFTLPGPSENGLVDFWMYRDNGYLTNADSINVYFNTSPGLTGGILLGTINRSINLAPIVAANGWYEYSFAMPPGQAGTGRYIIFEAVSAYGNNMFIDDVCITPQPPCTSNTWTGTAGNAWNNPGNWSCGVLPDATMSVIVPSGLTTYPEIPVGFTAECFDITVQIGAHISVFGTLNVVNP